MILVKSLNLINSRMKTAFKVTVFLVSEVLSFRVKKETSKNVADTTFMAPICFFPWYLMFLFVCFLKLFLKENKETLLVLSHLFDEEVLFLHL